MPEPLTKPEPEIAPEAEPDVDPKIKKQLAFLMPQGRLTGSEKIGSLDQFIDANAPFAQGSMDAQNSLRRQIHEEKLDREREIAASLPGHELQRLFVTGLVTAATRMGQVSAAVKGDQDQAERLQRSAEVFQGAIERRAKDPDNVLPNYVHTHAPPAIANIGEAMAMGYASIPYFAVSTGIDAYNRAKKQGVSEKRAMMHALEQASYEGLIAYAVGKLTGLHGLEGISTAAKQTIAKGFGKGAWAFAKEYGVEFAEEFVTEAVQQLAEAKLKDPTTDWTDLDWRSIGADVGFATMITMSGVKAFQVAVNESVKAGSAVSDADMERLIDQAMPSARQKAVARAITDIALETVSGADRTVIHGQPTTGEKIADGDLRREIKRLVDSGVPMGEARRQATAAIKGRRKAPAKRKAKAKKVRDDEIGQEVSPSMDLPGGSVVSPAPNIVASRSLRGETSTPDTISVLEEIMAGEESAIEFAGSEIALETSRGDLLVPIPDRDGDLEISGALAEETARRGGATVARLLERGKDGRLRRSKVDADTDGFDLVYITPLWTGGDAVAQADAALGVVGRLLAFADDTGSPPRAKEAVAPARVMPAQPAPQIEPDEIVREPGPPAPKAPAAASTEVEEGVGQEILGLEPEEGEIQRTAGEDGAGLEVPNAEVSQEGVEKSLVLDDSSRLRQSNPDGNDPLTGNPIPGSSEGVIESVDPSDEVTSEDLATLADMAVHSSGPVQRMAVDSAIGRITASSWYGVHPTALTDAQVEALNPYREILRSLTDGDAVADQRKAEAIRSLIASSIKDGPAVGSPEFSAAVDEIANTMQPSDVRLVTKGQTRPIPVPAKRKKARTRIPERSYGPDILNAIEQEGGIASKPRGYKGGEYDEQPTFKGVYTSVMSRSADRGSNSPDQIAARLQTIGIGDGTTNEMWRLIREALASRADEAQRTKEDEDLRMEYERRRAEEVAIGESATYAEDGETAAETLDRADDEFDDELPFDLIMPGTAPNKTAIFQQILQRSVGKYGTIYRSPDGVVTVRAKNGEYIRFTPRTEPTDQPGAGGAFRGLVVNPQGSVTAEVDVYPGQLVGTYGHELVHVFRAMGLITDEEIDRVAKASIRSGWHRDLTPRYEEAYAGISEERRKQMIREELVADVIERFSDGRLVEEGGSVFAIDPTTGKRTAVAIAPTFWQRIVRWIDDMLALLRVGRGSRRKRMAEEESYRLALREGAAISRGEPMARQPDYRERIRDLSDLEAKRRREDFGEAVAAAWSLAKPTDAIDFDAVRSFGTTTDWRKCGYIAPNGDMLDFSEEGHDIRTRDHREVGGQKAMQQLINLGYIRVQPEIIAVEIGAPPTESQIRRLIDLANFSRDNAKYLTVEVMDGLGREDKDYGGYFRGNRVDGQEFHPWQPSAAVVGMIQKFYSATRFQLPKEQGRLAASLRYADAIAGMTADSSNTMMAVAWAKRLLGRSDADVFLATMKDIVGREDDYTAMATMADRAYREVVSIFDVAIATRQKPKKRKKMSPEVEEEREKSLNDDRNPREDHPLLRLIAGATVEMREGDQISNVLADYIGGRIPNLRIQDTKVLSPADAAVALAAIRSPLCEHMAFLVVDVSGRQIAMDVYSIGCISGTEVPSTAADYHSILAAVRKAGPGATIYFAHNHPSGLVEHSEADTAVYHKLAKWAKDHGVSLFGLVLDGDQISVYDPGVEFRWSVRSVKMPAYSSGVTEHRPEAKSPEAAAELLKTISTDPSAVIALMTDTRGKVNGVRVMEWSFTPQSIIDAMAECIAYNTILATRSQQTYERITDRAILPDLPRGVVDIVFLANDGTVLSFRREKANLWNLVGSARQMVEQPADRYMPEAQDPALKNQLHLFGDGEVGPAPAPEKIQMEIPDGTERSWKEDAHRIMRQRDEGQKTLFDEGMTEEPGQTTLFHLPRRAPDRIFIRSGKVVVRNDGASVPLEDVRGAHVIDLSRKGRKGSISVYDRGVVKSATFDLDSIPKGFFTVMSKHAATPWGVVAARSLLVRAALLEALDPKAAKTKGYSIAWPAWAKGALQAQGTLERKLRLLLDAMRTKRELAFFAAATKPEVAISSSQINCDPSDGCAQECYAANNLRQTFEASLIINEIIDLVAAHHPDELGTYIAKSFIAERGNLEPLRFHDRGDGGDHWARVIAAMNAAGVRAHVFSKRPSYLSKVDDRNIRLLSIDRTNIDKAKGNDLDIAYVWKDAEDLPHVRRMEKRIQVVLPIRSGGRLVAKDIDKIPESLIPHTCPIDKGDATIGIAWRSDPTSRQWTCPRCDHANRGCARGQQTIDRMPAKTISQLFREVLEQGAREGLSNDEIRRLFDDERRRITGGTAGEAATADPGKRVPAPGRPGRRTKGRDSGDASHIARFALDKQANPVWYSQSRAFLTDPNSKMPRRGTGERMLGWLKNHGIGNEELYWSGLSELDPKKEVSREEMLAIMDGDPIPNVRMEEHRVQTRAGKESALFVADLQPGGQVELGVRRALLEAAMNGYDRLAWPTENDNTIPLIIKKTLRSLGVKAETEDVEIPVAEAPGGRVPGGPESVTVRSIPITASARAAMEAAIPISWQLPPTATIDHSAGIQDDRSIRDQILRLASGNGRTVLALTSPWRESEIERLSSDPDAAQRIAEALIARPMEPGFWSNAWEWVNGFWSESRRTFKQLDEAKHAILVERLKRLYNEIDAAPIWAVRQIADWQRHLTDAEKVDMALGLALPDVIRELEADDGLYADNPGGIPFYGRGQDEDRSVVEIRRIIEADLAAVNERMTPAVARAIQSREDWHQEFTAELVEASLLQRDVLADHRYFHRMVIKYLDDRAKGGMVRSGVRVKKVPAQYERVGGGDFSLNYLMAEMECIASMQIQLSKLSFLAEVDRRYGVQRDLKRQADNLNRSNMVEVLVAQAVAGQKAPIDVETMAMIRQQAREWDKPYRTRIAMNNQWLIERIAKGELIGTPFADLEEEARNAHAQHLEDVEQWKDMHADEDPADRPPRPSLHFDHEDWFPFLAYLASGKHGSIEVVHRNKDGSEEREVTDPARNALSVFSAIAERQKEIKKTLGKKFLTWKSLAQQLEGYRLWQPKPGLLVVPGFSVSDQMVGEVLDQIGMTTDEDLLATMPDTCSIKVGKLHRASLVVGLRPQWCLPEEVADQLDELETTFIGEHAKTMFARGLENLNRVWKPIILFGPWRWLKYEFNNLSGDLDAAISHPGILREVPGAAADLWRWLHRTPGEAAGSGGLFGVLVGSAVGLMVTGGLGGAALGMLAGGSTGAIVGGMLREAQGEAFDDPKRTEAERLGILQSGQLINEVKEGGWQNATHLLVEPTDGWLKRAIKQPLSAYYRRVRAFNAWREGVLRLAAARYFWKLLGGVNLRLGAKRYYGASRRDAMDELYAQLDAAEREGDFDASQAVKSVISAKLARELMGDYGSISVTGRELRRGLLPFWAWQEVNFPRYVRLVKNARYEGGNGTAAGIRVAGGLTARTVVAISALTVMATAWNAMMKAANDIPDEEDPNRQKGRGLYIILGRYDDGKIRAVKFSGALMDALGWLGADDVGRHADNIRRADHRGEIGAGLAQVAADIGMAPVQRMADLITPLIKTPVELITGQSYYPDVSRPREIVDRLDAALGVVGLSQPYRAFTDMASMDMLANGLVYDFDPGAQAYWRSRDLVREWGEAREDDSRQRTFALAQARSSWMRGEPDRAKRWLSRYFATEGASLKGYHQSIRMGHPLARVPKAKVDAFLDGLTEEDRRLTQLGIRWWEEVGAGAAGFDDLAAEVARSFGLE
jgi:hypothetical protein